MGTEAIVTALVGLLGALLGAAAGYLGSVRAAGRANRPAWASVAIEAARSLIESDDPARRAEGERLLTAAAAAIAGAEDAPEQLRAATRTADRTRARERAEDLARSTGSSVTFLASAQRTRSALPPPPGQTSPPHAPHPPSVLVSPRDVGAARAEVRAFRAAGLTPDPLTLAMAAAGTGPPYRG